MNNRYAQAVLSALLIVLASVSLRRAAAAAFGNEWQANFSISGGTLSPVPPSHPEIGGSLAAPPRVGIGGSPVPPPHAKATLVMIGGSPVPPPHVGIGGSPVPPPHARTTLAAIGGSPVPPPHGA